MAGNLYASLLLLLLLNQLQILVAIEIVFYLLLNHNLLLWLSGFDTSLPICLAKSCYIEGELKY